MQRTINITIESSNAVGLEMKAIALGDIARCELDDLGRLQEIANNKTALQKLKANWGMLKAMILG